jgi:mersacidin/lichenicidin family type 2 lantibiotic
MKFDIIRAWKDEAYRSSLSTEEQSMLPENPAGAFELSDAELETIHGAANVGGDISDGCTAGQQLGVILSNIGANGNDCIKGGKKS